jgi:outer membrane protein assembly factor BamB
MGARLQLRPTGRVYLGTLDGTLVALDVDSGKQVWSAVVGDWRKGETITSAPLYYDRLTVTGISGRPVGYGNRCGRSLRRRTNRTQGMRNP